MSKVLLLLALVFMAVETKKVYVSFKILGTNSPSSQSSTEIAQSLATALQTNTYNGVYNVYNYTIHLNGSTPSSSTTLTASTTSQAEVSTTQSSSSRNNFSTLLIAFMISLVFGQKKMGFGVLLIALFFSLQVNALNDYDHCLLLHEETGYQLYWNIDGEYINFAISAKTNGWLALGISQNGQMNSGGVPPGSDIFMGYYGGDCPTGCINDYSTVVYSLPILDDVQNLQLNKSSKSPSGVVTLEFRRKLVATDTSADLSINPVEMTHVIWSIEVDTLPANKQSFSKHDFRGTLELNFTAPSICPGRADDVWVEFVVDVPDENFDRNVFSADLSQQFGFEPERVSILDVEDIAEPFTCDGCHEVIFQYRNYSVPAQETFYACMGVTFPDVDDHEEHIVRFETIVDNSKVLHHLVLYTLPEGAQPYSPTPISCNMPNANPIYAWGPGGAPIDLPQAAGFKVGGSTGIKHAVLNFHYNNPSNTPGLKDSSAIRIFMTRKLRPNDAGLWFLGVDINNISIPPGHPTYHISSGCPRAVTQAYLSNDLIVFSQFSHMHYIGKRLWTEHFRNGELIGNLGNTTHYDFNNQYSVSMNISLKPGDELITHCVYDSTPRNFTTPGGEASGEEMCYNIVMYYPLKEGSTGCIFYPTPPCDCDMGEACLEEPVCTNARMGCSKYLNCSSCSADTNCGWCNSNSLVKCVDSSLSTGCGQIGGSWNQCGESPATPCVNHNSCDSCNADTANKCSWCGGSTIDPINPNCLGGPTYQFSANICNAIGGIVTDTCN